MELLGGDCPKPSAFAFEAYATWVFV